MTTAASYTVHCITDLFVLISDDDREGCRSVTNDADRVVASIHHDVADLSNRRVYYRDSMGNIDELTHEKGVFKGFGPCSEDQRDHLVSLLSSTAA